LRKLVDRTLFDADPDLAGVRALRNSPMASFDLYFTKSLPNIPRDIVVLSESKYDLTFLDNSQLWPDEPHTILNVVVSDYTPLVGLPHEYVLKNILIPELRAYVPFDPEKDIDWDRSYLRTDTGEWLFANQVGSWDFQPSITCKIPNLFFAGAFCRSVIGVVTIEGAVVTGLMAAEAVRQRAGLGTAIDIREPVAYTEATMWAMRMLLAPYAGAAKGWLSATKLWSRYAALFGW
jgi:hypothetical protein